MDEIINNMKERSKSTMLLPHGSLEFDKTKLLKSTSQKKILSPKERREKARQAKIDRLNNAH